MNLISNTTIKVKDLKEDSLSNYNEKDFLYSHPELFKFIYGVKFDEEYTTNKSTISDSKMIKVKPDRKIIIFTFQDDTTVWENKKVHNIRVKFLKQFKTIRIVYRCGYIHGTHSPLISGSGGVGLMSANSYNGYQFWQQVTIL